jgi:hypothetical protein
MRNSCYFSVLVLLSLTRMTQAWDGTGHMIIAQVAREQLNPNARAKVEQLAAQMNLNGVPYNAITLACWPDDIKHAATTVPHHGDFKNWHFIDLGCDPGNPDLLHNPPPMTITDGDAVSALNRCVDVIKNHTQDPFVTNEAMAVSLVMHLVGDLHQPLHCTSHYYLDGGASHHGHVHDAGGNAITVPNLLSTPWTNLHTYWDESYRRSRTLFRKIKAKPELPHTTLPDSAPIKTWSALVNQSAPAQPIACPCDFGQWATETHSAGCNVAYGNLPNGNAEIQQVNLSASYVNQAKPVAFKQLALAGYRLAALLNQLYPPDLPADLSLPPCISYETSQPHRARHHHRQREPHVRQLLWHLSRS